MKKESFYFTFGPSHKHPTKDVPMENYYVKVMSIDFNKAREMFMKDYGDKFAFQYTDKNMNFKLCSMGCYETIMQLDEEKEITK